MKYRLQFIIHKLVFHGGVKVSTGVGSKGCMPGVWVGPVKKPARL